MNKLQTSYIKLCQVFVTRDFFVYCFTSYTPANQVPRYGYYYPIMIKLNCHWLLIVVQLDLLNMKVGLEEHSFLNQLDVVTCTVETNCIFIDKCAIISELRKLACSSIRRFLTTIVN